MNSSSFDIEICEHSCASKIFTITTNIERIDINGQSIDLAASICLFGRLNTAKLLAIYPSTALQTCIQNLDDLTLQIGVDEAGRGPLLGSVHVAAALLPPAWSGLIESQLLQDTPLSLLTDSKKLSEKKRDILYPLIQQQAIGFIIADIPAAVIDQVNILQATMLGMRLCSEVLLASIIKQLTADKTFNLNTIQVQVLFDGNRCPELGYSKLAKMGLDKTNLDCQAWIKGDARHTSMAAASILAKVSRDQTMYQLDAEHPQYGIARHKGYPTRLHTEAIETYGLLPEHRRSFAPIKRALEKDNCLKVK